MDKFYIIENSSKDKKSETTKLVKDYLISHGKECMVRESNEQNALAEDSPYRYTNADLIPEDTECILVLGGDGTLIQAARDTVGKNIPLLGINLGTLGYLAEIEKAGVIPALDSLMRDEYSIENRMMLTGTAYHNGEPVMRDIALNDIVINRSGVLRVIYYHIYVNGEFLNSYAADGIIVSTPTGSTGYSLSAGGPIVSPRASMIILTPICPHTLNTRSIVLSGEDKVMIKIGQSRRSNNEEAVVSFDGENSVNLCTDDYVEIQNSDQVTSILKISNISFLEVLRNKMRGN